MSNRLLEQLEAKIDDIIETMEIMRLQVEELEVKNTTLQNENATLKNRQSQWEQGLTSLLGKLDSATPLPSKTELNRVGRFESEDIEALV